MTVHVVMPVFNRLAMTQDMLEYLRLQIVDEAMNIIIIDDGSTDGTSEYLSKQDDLTILKGNGELWWGGCVDLAMNYVFDYSKDDDWILLINNDTKIKPDFLQCLLNTARSNSLSAVGSIIRNETAPHDVLSVGAKINSWRFLIKDKIYLTSNTTNEFSNIVKVDALSGRGVLFPLRLLRKVNGMRSKWLPHYLADYELSLRVKKAGGDLLVDTNAAVYSKDEYGNTYRASSLKEKFFSIRSSSYLPAVSLFWWEASNGLQRLTLPFRVLFFLIFPKFRREKK